MKTILFSFLFLSAYADEYERTIFEPNTYTMRGTFTKEAGETTGYLTSNYRNGETFIFVVHDMDPDIEFSGTREMKIRIEERQDTKLIKEQMRAKGNKGSARIQAYFVESGKDWKAPSVFIHPSRLEKKKGTQNP